MSKLVENYLLQQPIGKGVYGKVYRAIHQKTKLQFAVKAIPKSVFQANPKLQQLAINQIKILSSLKNDHVVKFVQTLKTPNNFYFVYEYCNGGALDGYLHKKKFLSEKQALSFFSQLLDAFKQLNKNSVMHRDLKPDNIFLSDGKIKLGDFGFCKMLQVNMAQTMLGSPIYMAPEILRQQIYTSKADIWSLGVVLFEMLFGFCPFQSSSINDLINVLKQTQLTIPQNINPISQSTKELLQKILVKDQFKRIQWVDLFEYHLDQDGKMTCPQKKDYSAIQSLQNYFLFNQSNKSSKGETSPYISQKQIKFQNAVSSVKSNINRTAKDNKVTSTNVSINHFQPYSASPSFIPQQAKSIKNISSNEGSRKFIPSNRSPIDSSVQSPNIPSKIQVTSFLNVADQLMGKTSNINSQKNSNKHAQTNSSKNIAQNQNLSLLQSANSNQNVGVSATSNISGNNYRLNQSKSTNANSSYSVFPTINSYKQRGTIINGKAEQDYKHQRKLQNLQNNDRQIHEQIPLLAHQYSHQNISHTLDSDITTLKHTVSTGSPKKVSQYDSYGTNRNFRNKSSTFEQTHQEWTKAFQTMQQISGNPNYQKESTDTIIYWILISLNKKLNSQSLSFPEWTDVILQEKKAVAQALKQFNRIDPSKYKDYYAQICENNDGKNEILKFWKRSSNQEFKKSVFERAIRFMYSNEHNSNFTVEQVLLT